MAHILNTQHRIIILYEGGSMKKDWLVKTLALVVIVLFISVSFQPIIAIKSASDEEESNYNNVDFQQVKNYLFQTIVDMANNKDIQRIILKSQMSKGIFSVSDIPMLTKNKLRYMYFIGLILSKFISKSKMQSMIREYQFNNQKILNEINTVIEKDSTISKEIKQLSNLKCCDCEESKKWGFPIICTTILVMMVLMIIPAWILMGFLKFIGVPLYKILEVLQLLIIILSPLAILYQRFNCPGSKVNQYPFISDVSPANEEQNVQPNITELSFRLTDQEGDLMSYKVTTEPYIGEGSGTLVPNGTYIVPVHGVQPSTSYTWEINLWQGEPNGTSYAPNFYFTTAPVAPVISNAIPKNNAPYVPIFTSNVSFDLMDYQDDLMNWMVETQPDIGSGSAYGVGNGRYPVAISGLEYEKKYTWFLNATDGTYWTNKTYVFTTTSEGLLVFEPSADTMVYEYAPDNNWGSEHSIETYNNNRSLGLVLFYLSDIPAGSTIISANLSLFYCEYNLETPVGREITCHRILENWDEMTVTFNTRPDFDPVECASAIVPENYTWIDWNVSSEVNDFINGGDINYGWLIRDNKPYSTHNINEFYYSSDANNGFPPRLFVWFDNP